MQENERRFDLPDLGEGIHEAEVIRWHVAVGEHVAADAPLVDVETDKATVTVPSPFAGALVRRGAEVGETLNVGEVLAVIASVGGTAATPVPIASRQAGEPHGAGAGGPVPTPVPVVSSPRPAASTRAGLPHGEKAAAVPVGGSASVPAAPATRRLARELGVDIERIPITDPRGRVTDEDVRAAADLMRPPSGPSETARATAPAGGGGSDVTPGGIPLYEPEALPDFAKLGPVKVEPLRSVRRKIARHLVVSNLVAPRAGHAVDIDVTELEALRRRVNDLAAAHDKTAGGMIWGGRPSAPATTAQSGQEAQHGNSGRNGSKAGARLTLLSFVVKAVVSGLRSHPVLNASIDPDKEALILKGYYNIGVAVATERGLVVPNVKGAEKLSIRAISAEVERLAEAVREDKVSLDDLHGGTFTITNIGPLGGRPVLPLLHYPEAGILGMGEVEERPVVRDGQIVVRSILPTCLAFDHRIADGADAARFMAHVKEMMSSPERLLLEL